MSDHAENITEKKPDRDLISIIVPCYNEEKALPAFYRAAADAVKDIRSADCEFIFVDDGSRDSTPRDPGTFLRYGSQVPVPFLFPQFRKRSSHVRRSPERFRETTAYSWTRTSSTRRSC